MGSHRLPFVPHLEFIGLGKQSLCLLTYLKLNCKSTCNFLYIYTWYNNCIVQCWYLMEIDLKIRLCELEIQPFYKDGCTLTNMCIYSVMAGQIIAWSTLKYLSKTVLCCWWVTANFRLSEDVPYLSQNPNDLPPISSTFDATWFPSTTTSLSYLMSLHL